MVRFAVAMVAVLCLTLASQAQTPLPAPTPATLQNVRGVVKSVDVKTGMMTLFSVRPKRPCNFHRM